jgi:hypothetical protein
VGHGQQHRHRFERRGSLVAPVRHGIDSEAGVGQEDRGIDERLEGLVVQCTRRCQDGCKGLRDRAWELLDGGDRLWFGSGRRDRFSAITGQALGSRAWFVVAARRSERDRCQRNQGEGRQHAHAPECRSTVSQRRNS